MKPEDFVPNMLVCIPPWHTKNYMEAQIAERCIAVKRAVHLGQPYLFLQELRDQERAIVVAELEKGYIQASSFHIKDLEPYVPEPLTDQEAASILSTLNMILYL